MQEDINTTRFATAETYSAVANLILNGIFKRSFSEYTDFAAGNKPEVGQAVVKLMVRVDGCNSTFLSRF